MKYMLLIFLILILIIYIKKNIRENFDNKKKLLYILIILGIIGMN